MASRFRAGDLVEVLDAESIYRTLDAEGAIGRMPFMPEMLQHCGKRFRVSKVAHKTCDVAYKTGGRWVDDCYHLENLRCDGAAHGGCQATCMLFWKGSWLRKVAEGQGTSETASSLAPERLERLTSTTRLDVAEGAPVRYSCQTTRLFEATRPLRWWDPRQYVRDLTSGNVAFGDFVKVLFLSWLRALTRMGFAYRLTYGLYERVHRALTGAPAPVSDGLLPKGAATPTVRLDLQPGETVVVKSALEIRKTLNANNKNRGLWFDLEYVPFCGSERRVSHRVERILDERTGEMLEMKHPCIVLEGVKCEARYSVHRLFCPRAITAYWREAWLERPGKS